MQQAFSNYKIAGPIPGKHTNKWARPLPLFFAAKKLLAKIGILLVDGYKTYPDEFCEGDSTNIFQKVDHLPWQFLNPPYNKTEAHCLKEHIDFWFKHARTSRSGHVLVFPHLPEASWYNQLYQNPYCTCVTLRNPIWFLRLLPKMHFAGPARFRVILMIIGVKGAHFSLENNPLGYFSSENIDTYKLSLCYASSLIAYNAQKLLEIGPQLNTFLEELQKLENQRKEYAKKLTPIIGSPPKVNFLVHKNPMNWLGDQPPWIYKIHPQLRVNVYGQNLKNFSRRKCP